MWRVATLGLLALAACGEDREPAEAKALWERVHAEDYRSWETAPGYAERVPSRAAHGDAVQIFVNDVVAADLASDPPLRAWSDGATIVKDGYDGGELCLVAVMDKRDGDWFWAEYSPDGDAIFSGAPALCTGCHALGDDFVRGFFFPVGAP